MISPEFLYSNIPAKQSTYFLSIIKKVGKSRWIEKGESIIKYGSSPTFFFYIESGAFKTTILKNDKPYILGFTFADDIDCCPAALLKGTPNNFAIEAVVDSQIIMCSLNDFKNACTPEKYGSITNNILMNYIVLLENRVIDTLALTAEERYKNLLQKQPHLIDQIPLSQIASYLGITQERLSRIRKKISI